MNIDELIQIERDSLEIAIFPRERREHAEKLAELEKEKRDNYQEYIKSLATNE